MDNITVHHFITDPDRFTAAFAYLIVGSWTVTITGFIIAPFAGKYVDSDFTTIISRDVRLHVYAIFAGISAAVSTFFALLSYQTGDPSALVALSGATLVYIAIYDALRTKGISHVIFVPILISVIGSGMAAYTGSLVTTLSSLITMLLLSNSFGALSEIIEQRGVQRVGATKNCSTSLMLWRFLWMAISGTVMAFTVAAFRGRLGYLVFALEHALSALPFVILTMTVVFFAIGIKMVVKKTSLLSATLLIISSQVIFAYPITILGELAHPGLFGGLPSSFWVWIIRVAGAILLVCGILQIKRIDASLKIKTH
jgi:hypothetical protein